MDSDLTFIETQFPVSKLSKESYKERMGNSSQTLTGLGKWWGRKPLILVRAAILGLLLPATKDPRQDRAVFLKLLTMDPEGQWRRKRKAIALAEIHDRLSPQERDRWFDPRAAKLRLRSGTTAEQRSALQRLVFERLSYDEQLTYCDRPEQIDGPSAAAWSEINAHLGTAAGDLPSLVRQLGERRFGRTPRVGDAFCGGGSVPFEAARIGCDAYGSDLNPVAALLTWGALKIVGGGESVAERVRAAQAQVFAAVDRQITDWRIEHNDLGWRADAYLYCTETRCPECGWLVPLAPSWVIGEKTKTIARLVDLGVCGTFAIEIHQGVDAEALAAARAGTMRQSRLICPHCGESTAMSTIRGDRHGDGAAENGLRLWDNEDLVPRPGDTFQERLYCIRWRLPLLDDLLWADQYERRGEPHPRPVPDWVPLDQAIAGLGAFLDDSDRLDLAELRARDWLAEDAELATAEAELAALQESKAPKVRIGPLRETLRGLRARQAERTADLKALAERVPAALYRSVETTDLEREARVLALVRERFDEWQAKGYIPSRRIVPGDKTNEPIRTRGWTHWHHLFTPRQLLELGQMMVITATLPAEPTLRFQIVLWVAKSSERNSKIQGWDPSQTVEKPSHVFTNQALNTQYIVGVNSHFGMRQVPFFTDVYRSLGSATITVSDVRDVQMICDYWITDPPYADAIMYHELSEFFLSWYDRQAEGVFPDWYFDSKRALAVRGTGKEFRQGMVDAYRNLATHMPDNGLQIVMFTHQDAGVWADLALILWAAGLRVTAAWTIATETESALKEGNYVQGTVLMVLRKQVSQAIAFLDEVVPLLETEVERQLKSMLGLDDREDPNFSDADYQLAAYAAALRVLTQYRGIEDIDVAYELSRERKRGEASPIVRIIEDAVRTASDFLIPAGLEASLWKRLSPEEKLYLKCLEVESHGDYRSGVFQEFARGFGVRDYRFMLESGKANQTRLRTASEFKRRDWGTEGFGSSPLRHCLFAIFQAIEQDNTKIGLTYLKSELHDYWSQRDHLAGLLGFLGRIGVAHWARDAEAARLLAGSVANDHV